MSDESSLEIFDQIGHEFFANGQLTPDGVGLLGFMLSVIGRSTEPENAAVMYADAIKARGPSIEEVWHDFDSESCFSPSTFKRNVSQIVKSTVTRRLRQTSELIATLNRDALSWANEFFTMNLNAVCNLFFDFLANPNDHTSKLVVETYEKSIFIAPHVAFKSYFDHIERNFETFDADGYVSMYSTFLHVLDIQRILQHFFTGFRFNRFSLPVAAPMEQSCFFATVLKTLDFELRKKFADFDFFRNVRDNTHSLIELTGYDCNRLCSALTDRKWSDTKTHINHYFLVDCKSDAKMKFEDNFTVVRDHDDRKLIIHRRSHELADDPPCKAYNWNNWHPENAMTIDFAIRDELSRINPADTSEEELLEKTHQAALKTAHKCKTVVTVRSESMRFCSFGAHPNASGRVIRVFGFISIFVGF